MPLVFSPRRNRNPVSFLPKGFPVITLKDVKAAIQRALGFLVNIDNTEREIADNNLFARPSSSENQHQAFFGNNSQSRQLNREGTKLVQTAVEIAKTFGINSEQAEGAFQSLSFANDLFAGECPSRARCGRSFYRNIDGSCNNQRNPDWGKAFVPFNRIVFPAYQDGVDAPRTVGKSGTTLPSARQVSFTVAPDNSNPNKFLTLAVMQVRALLQFQSADAVSFSGDSSWITTSRRPRLLVRALGRASSAVVSNSSAIRISCIRRVSRSKSRPTIRSTLVTDNRACPSCVRALPPEKTAT